ncbi:MAG: hypothetical protein KKE86_17310, partial [Planctomycetes bacterium]|nr:hypothetical protein [Planctomycetota bacterium]
PALYAIREVGAGRMGLTVLWPIFTVYGGTTWIHDGAVLDKGLARRASDFGRLFANTLRWLAEPSLKSGKLGGYVQDPKQLVNPNFRRKPDEFFGQFDSYQNPTPPGRVFKGLIGARTAYSTGKGAVAEYAEAATRAGLDFVVFLETFGKISEANYRKLEQECKQCSTDKLLLIPGLTIDNNIGNHMFVYGQDILWPKPSQLDGPNKDQLRTQCFNAKGELTYNDEDAKNWIWTNTGCNPGGRNLGFFDFREKKGMLIRNLRLFGILGVISYRDGKLVEDVTGDYLDYVMDADPPLACAVNLVESPAQLEAAVQQRHYLTHVAAPALAKLPEAMWYGHAYGRANVYFSSDPEIRAWAGTQRFMSYAGESFVTARRRARPEAWVVSDAGLKEIVIYSETAPCRRFLLNGAKEFRQTFEWAYDRHREMVLVATDVNGRRAVSAARSLWADANANTWCGDRQNGEMWHGPITFPGPQRPQFATGPTWDGGPSAFVGAQYECHPLIVTKAGEYEGGGMLLGGRWMEGNVYPTCFDDSVANFACVGENNYAPGDVANAYHTLGPVLPAKYMIFTLRRTQFIQRGAGPSPDGHAFFVERVGGNLALIEGTITVKQDADLANVVFANIIPAFPKTPENYPLWAVRTASGNVGMGRFETFAGPGLGAEQPRPGFTLAPGDYVALIPAQLGNNSICFNVGDAPIQAVPGPFANWNLKPARLGAYKKGDVISWRYLVIYDGMDESAHNLMRVEQLRRYYGLAGEGGCGIVVKQGKLLSQKGLIDLAPENGVVDVTVPHPGWRLGLPLGIRFIGFNPKWTVGQLQVEGYSPGFYTNGRNVYRNLGLDDRHMAFVAVFPDAAKNTHNIVGHPVQCANPDLVIELTQLGTRPFEYRVAVNNPTDQPITTVLKKSMDLPGFEFADTRVEAPAGGYVVVKEK